MIKSLWHAGIEVSAEDKAVYNTMDDNLLTTVPMTMQYIAKEVLENKASKNLEDDITDEEEEEEDPPPPQENIQHTTIGMLMDYTITMKDVLCSSTENTSEMWTHLPALEKFFQRCFVKKQKQKTIQDFFKAHPLPL